MSKQNTSYSSDEIIPDFDREDIEELLAAALAGISPSLDTLWDRFSSEQRSEALKLIGMRPAGSLQGLVLKSLDSDNARERANAVEVLGKIEPEENLDRLEPYLEDTDNRVRANAVLSLWNVFPYQAREALRAMLRSPNMWMRASAAYVLSEVNNETFRNDLERLLDDEHDTVREKAIAALGFLGPGPSEERLLTVLADEMTHPFIKTEILKAFSMMGRGTHTDSASLVLRIAEDTEESDYVRLEAVKTLGHIGENEAEPFISALAANREVDEYFRSAAVESLGAIGGAEDLLLSILADPLEKDIIRERASFSLGRMSGSGLVEKLRNLLNEENEDLILSLIVRLEERGSNL